MGTGMGAGIIAEGRLIEGVCGLAGEVGHLRIADDGPIGYGKAGSFEGFASGGGIAKLAADYAAAQPTPPVWANESPSTKRLAELARDRDMDALAVFDIAGERLGEGISLLIDTLNPETVVIGSIFVRCEDLLRLAMRRAILREAIPLSTSAVRIVPAKTGEMIGDMAGIVTGLIGLENAGQMNLNQISAVYSAANAHTVWRWLDKLIERYPVLESCRDDIAAAYRLLETSLTSGGKILICGNGGSAADAEHIVGELRKGFRRKRPLPEQLLKELRSKIGACADLLQCGIPAFALTQETALSTAIANDLGGNLVYAQQILGIGQPNDILWGISTSGNAENVLLATGTAKAIGMKVLAMTGASGGKLLGVADVTLRAPVMDTAAVQELHLPIYHTLCSMLEAARWDA
jgi:D-sedoheptulose 7-phosphate isomerase